MLSRHPSTTFVSLKQRIMVRIYLWYVLSFGRMRSWWVGVVLGVSAMTILQLVSVGIVLHSIGHRSLVELPEYIFSLFHKAFLDGEFLLLMACMAVVLSGMYAYRLLRTHDLHFSSPPLFTPDQYSTN